jgi:hypothetical protein
MEPVENLAKMLNPSLSNEQRIVIANRQLENLIEHFDRKADKAKRWFHIYKYSSIVLVGATSVIASLELILKDQFPLWLLPVVSAGATIVVAFLGASNAQRLWVNSKTTGQRLVVERFLFNQKAGKYKKLMEDAERIRLFSEQMIQIWNEGHGKWEQTVNEG